METKRVAARRAPLERLANSRPEFDVQADLTALLCRATALGAARAAVIGADRIAVDERVYLMCRYCPTYGSNLMCPPHSATPAAFREYLRRYQYGVLFQVDGPASQPQAPAIRQGDGVAAEGDAAPSERDRIRAVWRTLWLRLHEVCIGLEREAFARGYYLKTGLVAGTCRLCDECNIGGKCKNPSVARPSMEACGIDVVQAAKAAGWGVTFPATLETVSLVGLVLVA